MGEDSVQIPRYDNIRNILYQLTHVLDERLLQYRKGSRYEKVWQSDTRVFVQATRRRMTLSEIARELKITRQAVQASVKRLRKLDVVDLEAIPGNRRDKCVVITPRGRVAQAGVVRQVALIEDEIAKALAPMDLETFRTALLAVLDGMVKKVALGEKTGPPAITRLE
ncbi:MAG: MarR family transcriptional regulator [Aestuariivirga sp.]